jgi:Ca-activated chloride channel family protein
MRRCVLAVAVMLTCLMTAQARGIVIPVDKSIPPLAMLNHRVNVTIEDQVAITKLEQTFRNHTSRELEATYVFPVPKGASVREFAMWVNGKKMKGELLEASKARQIYRDIVSRTQDPGLLEYIGQDVLKMQIYPVPAKGDQKIEVSYTSIARKDHEVIEYTYPLKTDGKATSTLDDFTMKLNLKSQQPILNIYSPTHAISINRLGDKEATIGFEKSQSQLDKDFQIFWTTSGKDVGLTALMHRPITAEDGYVLLLISPRAELVKEQQVPRDMVFVLDTSGSMRDDGKMEQAKKALKHCLDGLSEIDRFAIINFATVINRQREGLTQVSKEQIAVAKKWVDNLEPSGGTAINDALLTALELQTKDDSRTFTVVFFTDGKPTIGETNADKILGNVNKKNTAQTRIFTFGVGNDLNAAFLDQVAEATRAVSSFVRPEEDMEAKVSSFFGKISHPVLANLKLATSGGVSLSEIYPPSLPDLFHGGQVIALAKYNGGSHVAITLTGTIGKEKKEYVYEMDFLTKSEDKAFVEDLWARRKVGYLLEQIRLNGEKKELVEETTALAKKYGIATPYTSYLVVPDAPMPVAGNGRGAGLPLVMNEPDKNKDPIGWRAWSARQAPPALQGGGLGGGGGIGGPAAGFGSRPGAPGAGPGGAIPADPLKVAELAKQLKKDGKDGDLGGARGRFEDEKSANRPLGGLRAAEGTPPAQTAAGDKAVFEAAERKKTLEDAKMAFFARDLRRAQQDKFGVDLSVQLGQLKGETRQQQSATKRVGNRQLIEIGGVWIDDGFTDKMPTLIVKALSDGYFKLLERQPQVKDVLRLGNHLVWVTPSGTALIIDTNDGKDQLTDDEIDKLFKAK